MRLKILTLISVLTVIMLSAPAVFAKSIKFAQVSDVHYSYDGKSSNSRNVADSKKNLKFLIHSLKKQDIDFVVFLGDTIDKSKMENLIPVLEQTQQIKVPYYFAIGNHDSYKMGGIPRADYLAQINKYNKYQQSKKSNYYFYPDKDVIAIVLDGAMPFAPSSHGAYTDETIKWLNIILSKNSDKLVIIFQHFPLIQPKDNYSHTVLNPDKYFDTIVKNKNIVSISSGHYHIGKLAVDEHGVYHIHSGSLIDYPGAYNIVELTYKKKPFKKPSNPKIKVTKIYI